jgi:hypothetical protein
MSLGAGAGLDQEIPLGRAGASAPRLALRPRVSYSYQFSDAVVAVNDELDRMRVDPEGNIAPSDQLSGAALPEHLFSLSTRLEAHLGERLLLGVDVGLRYMRRHELAASVALCGNVATGCAEVQSRTDAAHWGVSTVFIASVGYAVTDYVELSLGYTNHAEQLGENGQYRGFFDSPGSRVFLSVGVTLDALYDEVFTSAGKPTRTTARVSTAAPQSSVRR